VSEVQTKGRSGDLYSRRHVHQTEEIVAKKREGESHMICCRRECMRKTKETETDREKGKEELRKQSDVLHSRFGRHRYRFGAELLEKF